MPLSANLSVIRDSSFTGLFSYGSISYTVDFEMRNLEASPIGVIYIPAHPARGAVKYILRKEGDQWFKFIGINVLDPAEEAGVLNWIREKIREYR
jgi:hypothetical protein